MSEEKSFIRDGGNIVRITFVPYDVINNERKIALVYLRVLTGTTHAMQTEQEFADMFSKEKLPCEINIGNFVIQKAIELLADVGVVAEPVE